MTNSLQVFSRLAFGRTTNDLQSAKKSSFDNLARSIASQTNRRDTIRVGFGGVLALILSGIGVRTAKAAAECLCGRELYDPTTQCCTPNGVRTKRPIANLQDCPDRVPAKGYTCKPNGCGAEGGRKFPSKLGRADILSCCNDHDCCWGECKNDRNSCDSTFQSCMESKCDNAYPPDLRVLPGGITVDVNKISRGTCKAQAGAYFAAVNSRFATSNYEAAQKVACDCCGDQPCQTCPGGTCSSLPSCQDPGCVCFRTVEGTGFCHRPQSCAGLSSCTSSSNCPSGWACVSVTCCTGQGAICIQPCFSIGPSQNLTRTRSLHSPATGPMTAPIN